MRNDDQLPATTLVIFGITGDLAHRYILPALAELDKNKQLPQGFKLLGLSRRAIMAADVLDDSTKSLQQYLQIAKMDMANPDDYKELKASLNSNDQIIFYLSTPPAAVLPIVRHLGEAGLNTPNVKLLLEKPFGVDLESARELIAETQEHFKEQQLYRIDHYLAKGMAQNISVFLSSNALIRSIWNSQFIEYVEIVVAEAIGIEGRANFYESTGALRDIVQSHLLQLAALTLMEPCPDPFDFSDLPERRLQALKQLMPPPPDKLPSRAIRAQYDSYKQEVQNQRSMVETFVALELTSTNPRWQGVPIYLGTGKNLDQRLTQIRINFKTTNSDEANKLIIRIQPNEGIELSMWAKRPGYEDELDKKTMSFDYASEFKDRVPDAYEQVLFDAMRSRDSLFTTSAEVLETWRILQPIITYWSMRTDDLFTYKKGSSVEQVLENRPKRGV